MKNDELKMKNEEILMTGSYNHSKLFCRFNNVADYCPGKKQLWATSLCHSLVRHTYGEL